MSRVLIHIEYDGTNYKGWQKQPGKKTIQSELESCLKQIFKTNISVSGSGRTDAKVHALNQVAHFDMPKPFETHKIAKAMSANLPKDIVVKHASPVSHNFHARKSCIKKTYIYKIFNSQSPSSILRNYTCYVSYPLDLTYLNDLAGFLIGEHDFTSFKATNSNAKTSVRTIYQAKWEKSGSHVKFLIEANGFLKQMIRNIVGTLLYMNLKKMPKSTLSKIIESRDRTKAFKAAPPQGLYLKRCYFNNKGELNEANKMDW